MHPSAFTVPKPGESLSKAKKRDELSARNRAVVKANPGTLSFMLDPKDPGSAAEPRLYNKRSSLPTAQAIVAFNRKRPAPYSSRADRDMRTETERRFSKKPSLKGNKASRNHKVDDKEIGAMLQDVVIAERVLSKQEAKKRRNSFSQFAEVMLEPIEPPAKRKKLKETFDEGLDELSQPSLTPALYRKHFDATKRVISGALPNQRLGDSPVNSGIGDSLDLNFVDDPALPQRPPSPISKRIAHALDSHKKNIGLGGLDEGHYAHVGKRKASSSFTPL